MIKQLLTVLLVVLTTVLAAQDNNENFAKANDLYKKGDYQQAAALYENILKGDQVVASELYFNLGNCYYKLNEVAPSIFNYEMALLVDPLNQAAANNLKIAQKLTLDRIEPLPKSLGDRIDASLLGKLHFEHWGILSIVFSILASLLFILFYFADISTRKRLYFIGACLSTLLLGTSLLISFQQYNKTTQTKTAIVYTQEVSVKNGPTADSEVIFTLHEGTKVQLLDTVDDWKKIKLVDGKTGWLKSKTIKILENL